MVNAINVFVVMMLFSTPVFANPLLQEGGREVTMQDWADRVPLVLFFTALAIIIDAIFIGYMLRSRRKQRQEEV
jgi:multisubunit Na+/H+ antiporter MnhC subunit